MTFIMTRRKLLVTGGAVLLSHSVQADTAELICGPGEFRVYGFGQPDSCQPYSKETLTLLELADGEPEPLPQQETFPAHQAEAKPEPATKNTPEKAVRAATTAPEQSIRPEGRPSGFKKLVANLKKPQPRQVAAVAPKVPPKVATPAVRTQPAKGVRYVYATSRYDGKTRRVPYFADGTYIDDNNGDVNQLLCDWRTGETTDVQRGVLDFQSRLRHQLGIDEPWFIISGYRSPKTNAMLRAKSNGGVAKRSLHTVGMALDLRLQSRTPVQIFQAAYALGMGGSAPYSGSNFTHIDCGRNRTWGEGSRYV